MMSSRMSLFLLSSFVVMCIPLSGCTSDSGRASAKTFDAICSSEPALYAAFVTVATARHASERKIQTAAAAHGLITQTCANPPADLASGAAALASAYATIVSARAEAGRGV